jgi:AraC-like DNA-binding protein
VVLIPAPPALQAWALALVVQRAHGVAHAAWLPAHGLLVATQVVQGQVTWLAPDASQPAIHRGAGQCHVHASHAQAQQVHHSADGVSVTLLCRASLLPHAWGESAAVADAGEAAVRWWQAAPWPRWTAWACSGNDDRLAAAVWPWLARRCLAQPESTSGAAFRAQLRGWLGAGAASRRLPEGWGERRWQRACLHETGLTPSQLWRLWRVHRAAAGLAQATPGGWADWALTLGYSDQAHLSREMKTLLGEAPRQWHARGDHTSLALAQRYGAAA